MAFLLRLLPSHRHLCANTIEITDPTELDIAEQNLIHLAQSESFTTEMRLLYPGKAITRNRRITNYSPFIGPAGTICSTRRISRLFDTVYDSRHPIILYACHHLVRLKMRHLHFKHFHQVLHYMCAIVSLNFTVLKPRCLLRNIENNCFTHQKLEAKIVYLLCLICRLKGCGTSEPLPVIKLWLLRPVLSSNMEKY